MSVAQQSPEDSEGAGEFDAHDRLEVFGPDDAGRDEVEAFIRRIYARRYGARVQRFAPQLVALREAGRVHAAAGYRPATGPLFLEQYLDAPIEQLLAAQLGRAPAREHIVEVGHLAAAGGGRRLILRLGRHLAAGPYHWAATTLTSELCHLFVRMGITPLALGIADPARLGMQAREWGSYYAHHPVVVAGHLEHAVRRIEARMGAA